MKKVLLFAIAIVVGLASGALADSVIIVKVDATVNYDGMNDVSLLKSADLEGFTPTSPEIIVTVSGLRCTLASSAAGSVPSGCNYTFLLGPDNTVSGELALGNEVCTQTSDIPASCVPVDPPTPSP